MANVITSFLVGIGYDTTALRAGEREIGTSMEGIKSLATTTGAAITAAFVGVGRTAIETAGRVNELRLSTNTLQTSTQQVNDYGNAIRSMGGDAGDAVSEIGRVETALINLRNKGDTSTFTELAYAGVNIQPLTQAESGGEFMKKLAEQFPNLSGQQQMMVQQTLGLSPASVELLRKGSDGYQQILNHVHEVAGLSDDLIQKSKEYNAALGEAQNQWEGIANTITSSVLPGMTDIVNKGSQILSTVIKPMAERSPEATGAGLSMLGAGVAGTVAGPLLSAAGMGATGAAVGALGLPVAAAGAGTLAWNMNQQDVKNLTGYELPSYLWDKKVFDESQGDTANGMLHSDSFLGRTYNQLTGTSEGVDNGPIEKARSAWQQYTGGYQPSGGDNNYNSASATGEAIAEKLYKIPLTANVNVNNDLTVELDGQALDSKITDVTQRNNQMTVDDLQSTTAR